MKSLGNTEETKHPELSSWLCPFLGFRRCLPLCSHPQLLSCHRMNGEGSLGITNALGRLCSMEKPAMPYSTRTRNDQRMPPQVPADARGSVSPSQQRGNQSKEIRHSTCWKHWLVIQALVGTDRQASDFSVVLNINLKCF